MVTLTLPPTVDSVSAILDAVERWAEAQDVPPGVAHRLGVVMEELAANVAMHGTRGAGGATFVTVTVARDGNAILATVEDDGRAFDPLDQAAPDLEAALEAREVGGLGVHFARRMTRELRYVRDAGRNRVTAVFDAG